MVDEPGVAGSDAPSAADARSAAAGGKSAARPRPADARAARPRPADARAARPRPADARAARPRPADAHAARPRPADARAARGPGPREALRLLVVAAGFLTRLPLPAVTHTPGDLRRASGAFPIVGVAVAGIGVALRAAGEPLWGPVAATLVAVAGMVAVTGALHEDALADTADGLWGGWSPAERLAIMRDSRIGTYGAVALLACLGLRVALLAPLGLAGFARAAVCAHVAGRAGMVLLARLLPAASDRGSGAAVAGGPGRGGAWLAAASVALAVGLAVGRWAPLVLAVGTLVAVGCARVFRRRLGGVVGDALGAGGVAVEVAVLAAVSGLAGAGLL